MTQEEIENRIEICPWTEKERGGYYVCSRYIGTFVPCDGCCSWVVDYPKLKELEARKEKLKDSNQLEE